jgi:hypothetical protein
MSVNIRSLMGCIGIGANADVSVLRDLFGFSRARVPPDPTGIVAEVSLLTYARDLQGKHIHLNVIRVGFDAIAAGDQPASFERLDYGILRIRDIYRQVPLGIGRVLHWDISAADSNGRDDLGSEDEADELSDEWSVPNSGIDVFVVRNISDGDFIGISPIDGSCDKDSKDDGLIGGEINRGAEGYARTFAHEVGHFLGLEHPFNHDHDTGDCPGSTEKRNRIMAQTRCAVSIRNSTNITSGQRSDMRDHCAVRSGC